MLRRICENFLPLTLAIAIAMAVTAYEFIGQTRIYRGDQQAYPKTEMTDSLAQKPDTSVTNLHEARLDTVDAIWFKSKAAGSEITTPRPIGFFSYPWLGDDVNRLTPADSDLIARAYIDDVYNPLTNRLVLDQGIIIVAVAADTSVRVISSSGGDFTVMLHDTVTTVTSDSALEVRDDDVTFIWADEDGALQVATTGFPENPDGGEDSTVVELAAVYAESGAMVWINTHYANKKSHLIVLTEYLEEITHHTIHSGFETSEGTSSNLGFDFGAGGTSNLIHSLHGWHADFADDADLTFVDDIYSGGSGTTFGNTVYGNNVAMNTNYYSKFRLWMVANNGGVLEFHITRSTSQWSDVAQARAADWPTLPAGYLDVAVDLLGVVYKKNKTWDNLDDIKDWIVTDFTAKGVSVAGGAVGLGVDDVGAIAHDSAYAAITDIIIGAAAWTTEAHVGFKVMPWVYNDVLLAPIDSELVTKAYIDNVSGTVPDLPYYFNRNVVQLMAASRDDSTDYTNWANWSAGVHTDNTTTYLTDWQSITITIPSGGQLDGATLDITNYDFTHFTDGDTSTTADYILIAIYILTQDITDLSSSNLQLIFGQDAVGTVTNAWYTTITYGSLSNGWNFVKVAKSAFSEAGTGDWSAVKWIGLRNDSNATGAEVVFSFDYIAMVRDDPDAAEPNPFQHETTNGTWTADWTEEGNSNVWLVEESGVLAVMSGDGTSSHLKATRYYNDYFASGMVRISSASTAYLWTFREPTTGYSARLSGDSLIIADSTGTTHGTTFAVDASDIIYWKAAREGTSISILASLTGENWTGRSTFGKAGVQYPGIYLAAATQRLFSVGFSAIEYAAEAGMAYRVEWLFYRNDTLFIKHAGTKGDSLGAIVPAVILKE